MAKKKVSRKTAKKVSKPVAKKTTRKATRKTGKASSKKAAARKARAPVAAKPVASPGPIGTQVAELAYRLYEDRIAKGLPGDAKSDWLAAEELLSAKSAPEAA